MHIGSSGALGRPRTLAQCTTASSYVSHAVGRVSSKTIVRLFAGVRIGIGVAFALAPEKLGRRQGTSSGTLIVRSFAVRELVLGIGALLALAESGATPSAVRTWAGLGAMTDAGDFAAGLAGIRRREPSAGVSAVVAASGLGAEFWAFSASVTEKRART
jgi:hypothetical protein